MADQPAAPGTVRSALTVWFRTRPRRHGEVEPDRTVSFLELFYDLVFVVLVAQVAHALAKDVTAQGFFDFAVIYGLVWIAWLNGSLYHEAHGREDGRARTQIFVQMLLLVVLAVYAEGAAGADSTAFAISYSLLLLLLASQWWGIRRVDVEPVFRRATANYVAGQLIAVALILGSLALEPELRMWVWGLIVVGYAVTIVMSGVTARDREMGITATDSLVERFGLFTIIVLGEVVVGVVDGLLEGERAALTIATGLIALTICFGFWWNYFDSVGRRLPRRSPVAQTIWVTLHLPLTGAIAAAGAAMVGLIEHATEAHTPPATAWLLGGSSAAILVLLALVTRTIDYDPSEAPLAGRFAVALVIGAAISLVVAALAPSPWLLALALSAVYSATWVYAFTLRAPIIARMRFETTDS